MIILGIIFLLGLGFMLYEIITAPEGEDYD